ncbi:MAG: two-component system, sensor histidine kinase YesM [Clostridiales bacterium]|nr:two-component system, sensor histidine kinase YesM [Clostridiales bacterium]
MVLVPPDDVAKEVKNAIETGIWVMISSLIVALVFIILFSKVFSNRIFQISNLMHNVALGNFSLGLPIKGKDEIGQLWEDLYTMVEGIKKLMEEIKNVNEQKHQLLTRQQDIKFRMLVNQINPHFLFNSLEAIRMKAHAEGNEEVSRAIRQLGMIIRKTIEVGNKPIPLKDELELVRNYLELQKFRCGNRINFSINVEEERLNSYNILPFIIQPLVENAVVHGLKDKRGNGNVKVTVKKEKTNLIILVEDDGKGIDEETLAYLAKSFEDYDEREEQKIGLKNVHQRIRLFYGPPYGIKVDSKINIGTKVTVFLPEGEEKYV